MLETERLILRPMNESDIDDVFEMRRDDEIMRFIREPVSSRREAEDWINMISSRWAKDKIGFCGVIEKQSGRFAGWCGLWQLKENKEIEIGYAIAGDFWKKGFATEAADAILNYAFSALDLEIVVAVARPENTGSRRVMEKIGMKFDYIGKFYERDLVHYSVTKDDYFRCRIENSHRS